MKRILHVLFAGACLVSSIAPVSGAARIELVAPLRELSLTEPQYPPPPGGPKIYTASGEKPNWTLSEWNIPGNKLPPFKKTSDGYLESRTVASTVKLRTLQEGMEVTISQDGSYLPCTTEKGQPSELDMFLSPNNPATTKPPSVAGMLNSLKNSPPLSRMDHLSLSVHVAMVGGIAGHPKGCKVNLGSVIIGVILRDIAVQPSQSIFYQFALGRVCGNNVKVPLKPCSPDPGQQVVYADSNPFGNDDYLPLLHEPWLSNGHARDIEVDLLPRIKEAIATRYKGNIDRDLSHWVVGEVYPGQHIWGDVSMVSTWSNFHLVAETKD